MGTKSIVRVARLVKSYLIYVSTDYVFDGEKGMYKEDNIPNPINYYGLTRLITEVLVSSSNLLYTIVSPARYTGLEVVRRASAEFVVEKLS